LHLLQVHIIDRDGARSKKSSSSIADQVPSQPASSRVPGFSYGRYIKRYGIVFDDSAWKGAITALFIQEHLASRLLESHSMRRCLTVLNSAAEPGLCLACHRHATV
jgi:hypothetical protein